MALDLFAGARFFGRVVTAMFGFIPLPTASLPMRPGLWRRLWHNRRSPASRFLLVKDVLMNVSDEFYRLAHRIPPHARIERDRNGKYRGSEGLGP